MKRVYILISTAAIIYGSITFYGMIDQSNVINDKISICNSFSVNDKECSFCHNDIINHKFQHAPVTDDCQTCHQSTGNKHPRVKLQGFTLIEKTPDLCYICHVVKNEKSSVHKPVGDGDCSACHSPHGSENQYFLPKSNANDLCAECHDMDYEEKNVLHGALEMDGCKTCHNSHQSDNSFLLVEEKTGLCMMCHDNIGTEKNEKFQHVPFEDDCSNCHSPHNTKDEHLLLAAKEELCFMCHDDISADLKEAKHIHSVLKDDKGCANCHSPHASGFENILISDQKDLCFSCHNEEIETEQKTIADIEEKIKSSKIIHAPVEFGCGECHDPHASLNSALLKDAYPEGDYTSANEENFKLCFNCHDSGILLKDASSTNFRNGDQNLHFVHINGAKGRNCSVCHDVHASNNIHLVKSRTTFGTWNMPMNFIVNDNGGSCRTGCHTEKEYLRATDITNKDSLIHVAEIHKDTVDHNMNILNGDSLNVYIQNDVSKDTTQAVEYLENDTLNNVSDNIHILKDTVQNVTNTHETGDTDISVVDSNEVVVRNLQKDTSNVGNRDNNFDGDSTKIINEIRDTINTDITATDTSNVLKEREDYKKAFKALKPIRIYFQYAKDEFAESYDDEIDRIAEFMKAYPGVFVEIGAHTDNKGSVEYNIELSRKRAEAVKKLITGRGVVSKSLLIKAYGESKPESTNETETGRAKNRRVEFKLIEE